MNVWRTAMTKAATAMRVPQVKYGVISLGVMLWSLGLFDQFYSSTEATMKYLAISALMVALAVI